MGIDDPDSLEWIWKHGWVIAESIKTMTFTVAGETDSRKIIEERENGNRIHSRQERLISSRKLQKVISVIIKSAIKSRNVSLYLWY